VWSRTREKSLALPRPCVPSAARGLNLALGVKNRMRSMPASRLHFAILALCASGCASTPAIQSAASSRSPFDSAVYGGETTHLAKAATGEEAFRAFYQGGSGFVSLASVRETVEDMATKHCARQDKNVRLLHERSSTPPHVLGNLPRTEWVFECAARSPATTTVSSSSAKLEQIERLKKLLDSGALTQQEFDREKSKLLSAP
jgi:Short C-terminal domain